LQLTPHDDYEKWAITILVKFRDTEQLQQLTAHRQSGGVRRLLQSLLQPAFSRIRMHFPGTFFDNHIIPHEHDRACTSAILVGR
jgi:hypothetical protein